MTELDPLLQDPKNGFRAITPHFTSSDSCYARSLRHGGADTEREAAMGLDQQISGIAHVGIRVHDLETSRAFYERLGFKFLAGPLGPEPVAILEHSCGTVINFILNASSSKAENVLMDVAEKHAGYTHMALAVSDLDAVKTVLDAEGVAITEGPVEFPGARALFIRDPDGNVIEFNQAVPIA
jgi:lactoylglutathione lyase